MALHSLRNLLITRRQNGKESFNLFIDLVKAFDTIDQNIIFMILEKYGILHELHAIIKKMCTNVQLQFMIGKEKCFINYTNEVFQGDNASPILSLFVIMAATDSFTMFFQLEDKPTFHYFPEKRTHRSKIADSKASALTQQGPPFKLSIYAMSMMVLSYATTGMTSKDSHKISIHIS